MCLESLGILVHPWNRCILGNQPAQEAQGGLGCLEVQEDLQILVIQLFP